MARHTLLTVALLGLILLAGCDFPRPMATRAPFATRVPPTPAATRTPLPSATPPRPATRTPTPPPTHTLTATASSTSTRVPTATSIPASTSTPSPVPTETNTRTATGTPSPRPTLTPTAPRARFPPAVLANYFPWYDPGTWDTGCTSDGDQPRDGVYNSDDGAVIARHIAQARAAGLDGLAVHWFQPGNRTDTDLSQMLERAPDGFSVTVTFLHHILPGVKQQGVIDALRYVISTYSQHPRFFRVGGKPVILFSDMGRVPNAKGDRPASDKEASTAVATWRAIRAAVDPEHQLWWIAEGLSADYLAVFDGLYVYKIDHACCPKSYQSASRWAGWVRDWERSTGQTKLWAATVMPGWDDLNSAQGQCADLRVSSDPFARDREDGAYYERTWEAALASEPDFVLVHSFNEWVEGSYIEPSVKYGERYLALTAEWAARYKGQ
jgi:hypothetical protein